MNVDALLSDNFAEFAVKIQAINDQIKEEKTQVKALLDEHKAKMESLKEEAKELLEHFNMKK